MPEPRETAVYTHGHHESVLRSHTWRTAANSAAYLLGSLKPHMRVLDIGCGPGTITADLAALVPDGQVTGVDRAPGILDQARATAAERGLDNVDFAVADVHALDFPDDTFCVVHAHQVLQHVGDPVRALREMRRVTQAGRVHRRTGLGLRGHDLVPGVPGMDEWLDLYRRVARANGGEPDAGRRLKSWALRAGLTDITATSGTWTFATAEERAWWSGLWADRTVASAYAERAAEGGHADAGAAAGRGRRPGGSGGSGRTAGSACCTERFSAERTPESRFRETRNAGGSNMVPILLVLLLVLILFGAGFAVKILWWIALAVLVLWLLGFLMREHERGRKQGPLVQVVRTAQRAGFRAGLIRLASSTIRESDSSGLHSRGAGARAARGRDSGPRAAARSARAVRSSGRRAASG